MPESTSSDSYLQQHMQTLITLLAPDGVIFSLLSSTDASSIYRVDIETLSSPLQNGLGQISLARTVSHPDFSTVFEAKSILIVEQQETVLGQYLYELIANAELEVRRIPLDSVTPESVPAGSIIISLLES